MIRSLASAAALLLAAGAAPVAMAHSSDTPVAAASSTPGFATSDATEYEALKSAMVSHLSRHDATGLIVDRSTLGEMHSDFTSWVTRFEGLPETGRRAWETLAPKPGLTLRSYHSGDSELLVQSIRCLVPWVWN